MELTGNIFFNSTDIYSSFGAYANQGFYGELLKTPQVTTYTKDWEDENGTERDFTTKEYQPRTCDLPFFMHASSDNELLANYDLLKTFLKTNATFFLKVLHMDRSFEVKYRSMPQFNKLSIFKNNDKVCVSFNLSLTEAISYPYLDYNGDEITLTYPPDTTDTSIDFNDYEFEIVGTDLIMTGPADLAYGNSLNGNDFLNTYGVYFDQKSYDEFLKFADQKTDIELLFSTRSLSLPFILIADDETDFYSKWWSLSGLMLDKGYFYIDVKGLLKRFELCYSDMPTVQKLTLFKDNIGKVCAKFTLNLFDDFPTTEVGINIFDGHFEINGDGELIYTQSDYWNDKINFYLDNGNLIKEIF